MYRSGLEYLEDWKERKKRKPLVIRGARQVGKSFLVSMFAEEYFPNFIEINFERTPELVSVFNGSPEKAIQLLELHYNKKIDKKNTLIF